MSVAAVGCNSIPVWIYRDPAGELVCLTVYRRGAREVVRRLDGGERMAA